MGEKNTCSLGRKLTICGGRWGKGWKMEGSGVRDGREYPLSTPHINSKHGHNMGNILNLSIGIFKIQTFWGSLTMMQLARWSLVFTDITC